MNKIFLAIAVSLAVASPALANEGRVEARGGVIWSGGNSEATAGLAAGYDWDLGQTAFFGIEGSADKVLVSGSDPYFGLTARAGVKAGANGKLFVAGGYTVGDGQDKPHLGAGYEHKLGTNLYLKGEYRHFFSDSDFDDTNTVSVGIGYKF